MSYQHDRTDGTKDHLVSIESAKTGTCSICGERVFDPDDIERMLDKLNQEWRDETLAGAVQNVRDAWHKAWQPVTDTISDRLVRLFVGKR